MSGLVTDVVPDVMSDAGPDVVQMVVFFSSVDVCSFTMHPHLCFTTVI